MNNLDSDMVRTYNLPKFGTFWGGVMIGVALTTVIAVVLTTGILMYRKFYLYPANNAVNNAIFSTNLQTIMKNISNMVVLDSGEKVLDISQLNVAVNDMSDSVSFAVAGERDFVLYYDERLGSITLLVPVVEDNEVRWLCFAGSNQTSGWSLWGCGYRGIDFSSMRHDKLSVVVRKSDGVQKQPDGPAYRKHKRSFAPGSI